MKSFKIEIYTSYDGVGELMKLDKTFVGTDKYMGLAYFWNYAYRHWLRSCSVYQRVRVHYAFRAANLALDGESPAHLEILKGIVKFNDRA